MIATDAWYPQVNGVVRTLDNTARTLVQLGHTVKVFSHEGKKTWPLPFYPEIRLAHFSQKEIAAEVKAFEPDCIHIATEGPVGLAMRRYCLNNGLSFTTGYHTRFAEYASARLPVPGVEKAVYALLRWFHRPSKAVLTPTKSISRDLEEKGFRNVITWTRGVDHQTFRDYGEKPPPGTERPVLAYVGRLAIEKGIEDFLGAKVDGTKLVIGDGPSRARLEKKYPDAVFTGYLFGEELARKINSADLFVFPSKSDTFGLVMIEAMACGLPVAAYPVMGPVDVVQDGVSGALDKDLSKAIERGLTLEREDAKAHAATYTWENTARMLLDNLVPVRGRQHPVEEPEQKLKAEMRNG